MLNVLRYILQDYSDNSSVKSGNVAFILTFNHDRQMPRWQGGVQTATDLLATITSSDMMTVSWTDVNVSYHVHVS